MIILYIDCSGGFSQEMLLGALVDMGASPGYIQLCLQDGGIDAEILHSSVIRDGMEGTLAYCSGDKGTLEAVFAAIESFSPEFIICGNMPDSISDEARELMERIANEYGAPPDGFIMCDGYGADFEDRYSGLLRCVLYNCGEPVDMLELAEEIDLRIYV